MANTVINTPELLNLDSTTGATVLAKGTVNERPPTPGISVDYLVVAGGGGGGTGVTASTIGTGGGGGAGGLRTSFNNSTTTTNSLSFPAGKTAIATYMLDNDATDISGNYNGTASNISYNTGKYGGGAVFNGSSSKIDLGNNSSNNTATLSVSLWFKTAGHSATATLINNGGSNSGETGYYLGLNSDGTIKFEAGTGTVNGAVNYADSNWHQIVLTLNSGAYNIYVDGNTTPVITGSGAFTTTATRPTWIGQFSYTSSNIEFFEGSIDQVRLYNVVLSATDVSNIYTNEVQAPSGGGSAAESSLSLLMATNYTVTIGNGGNGGTSGSSGATNGQDSVFSSITSVGGGAGGSYRNPNSSTYYAQVGGSGGGAAYTGGLQPGAAGTIGQGYQGGDDLGNSGAPAYGHGGGGGAAAQGVDGGGTGSGAGGSGLTLSITGTSTAYGGGGGGGGVNPYPAGAGGTGGGGTGGYGNGNAGTAGTANTGGGGGGGGKTSASGTLPGSGADGGSGIVILRYASTTSVTVGSGLSTSILNGTVSGSTDKYTIFTSGTGTITFATSAPNPNSAVDGVFRFNTDTNKTEYFDGTGWYEIVDEYASGFVGPATNYFDTKLYTGNSAIQSIGGYINGTGSFNSSSSLMTITDGGIGASGTARVPLTVSLWVNTTASNQSAIINDYGTTYAFYIQMESSASGGAGKLSVASNYSGGFIGTAAGTVAINDGDWHHLVLVNNTSDNTQKLYIDGNTTPVISHALSTGTKTANPIAVGYYVGYVGTYNFNGSVDQIRFYDTALSASDVAALNLETATTATTAAFPSGQTAVATYTMDTSANGLLTTTDLSTVDYPAGTGCIALYEMNGNSNDTSGTYNGTPTNITYQGGAFDQAAVFNGSSGKIDLPNLGISGAGTRTISAWVNTNSLSSAQTIFQFGPAAAKERFGFAIDTAGKVYVEYYGRDAITSSAHIVINTWFHVAVTYNGGAIETGTNTQIYVNGVAAGMTTTGSSTGAAATGNSDYGIGYRRPSSSQYFNGSIDQVRIFNTELTQSQVTTLARGIATSYSGSSTDVNFNGYFNFEPGLVWLKQRSNSQNHGLFDTLRGVNNFLISNSTDAADTRTTDTLSSFNANGFTLTPYSSDAFINYTGRTMVAWCWKAGGTAVTNNDGTIASQVSANKDSGFSIVEYTSTGTSGSTVGHGLGSIPDIVLIKSTSTSSTNWIMSVTNVISNQYLYLNNTGTGGTGGFAVDATNVTLNNTYSDANTSGRTYVAYCWHSVAGFSRIGTYTGTGASHTLYTTANGTSGGSNPFQPSFLIIKRTDSADAWQMYDNKRGVTEQLMAQSADAEYTQDGTSLISFNSNGFTLGVDNSGRVNASSAEYLYIAIA